MGRFCMLNRRNYTRNGHAWNPMPDMELDSLRRGSFFCKGGSREGGFGRTPPPTGYGPAGGRPQTSDLLVVKPETGTQANMLGKLRERQL